MKVGITGGTGFLGTHVSNEFTKRNISFELLDKKRHNLLDFSTLESFVKDKTAIIHLAGLNIASDEELIKVNTLGTENLAKAIEAYGNFSTKIIFASSFQVYVQKNVYGLSKKNAEQILERFAKEKKLRVTILRFSNIYGPMGKPFYNSVIATFVYQALHSEIIKINGSGNQVRDYIYVSDVVQSIVKALEYNQEKPVERFDICTGKLWSLNQVLDQIEDITGKKIKVEYTDFPEENWNLNKNYEYAKKILKWAPQIELREGLVKTVNAYEH